MDPTSVSYSSPLSPDSASPEDELKKSIVEANDKKLTEVEFQTNEEIKATKTKNPFKILLKLFIMYPKSFLACYAL